MRDGELTDVPRINAIGEVGADMLRKIGMNVDVIATDWGTTVQRTVSRQAPDKGGWHMFTAFSDGIDMSSLGTHQLARGNSAGAFDGWPELRKLDSIRDKWLSAPDLESQRTLTRDFQLQAMQDVPYLPIGSYQQPAAWKSNIVDVPRGTGSVHGNEAGLNALNQTPCRDE